MLTVENDMTINITRGDSGEIRIRAFDNVDNEGEKLYVFQPGEVVRLKIFEKNACENVVLQKDFPIEEEIESVSLILTADDTRIGKVISKPVDYWYEIELNPDTEPQTIVGYDDDGAKIFRLYPEGRDISNDELTEEEFVTLKAILKKFKEEEIPSITQEYIDNNVIPVVVEPRIWTLEKDRMYWAEGRVVIDKNGWDFYLAGKRLLLVLGEGDNTKFYLFYGSDFEVPCEVLSGVISAEGEMIGDVYSLETDKNRVYEINEDSTDYQYPSAKAVYDFVGNGLGGSGSDASAKRHYNTFSVLGDSYSTFVDFVTPNTNLCWYPAGNPNATGSNNDVSKIEQMWWHIFANQYESALQVNNSYSGSPISYDGWGSGTADSKETGFIARAKHIGTPELIFVFGGSNDSWVKVPLGEYKYADWVEGDFTSFRPSLAYLLNYLKQHNAGARIVFILSGNIINSGNQSTATNIDESVLTICNHYGVEVVELDAVSVSNGHPTAAGQQSIAQQVYDYITSSKLTGISATISKSNFASGITLNDLKPYLTVTATYDDGTKEKITDYQLNGTVNVGNNSIIISCGAYSTTIDIVVSEVELTDISAQVSQTEFTMGAALDNIKPYLTVTGHYADGSTSVVNDYELSGELIVGENTITISYGGKTTTVTVTIAVESGTYQLSVETLDASNYQYYCPVFYSSVNENIRVVFTRDFELFSGNTTIKKSATMPTSLKQAGTEIARNDISTVDYVDITTPLTSEQAYFTMSIPTAAVNPLTLKNFHCYIDGVEVEPVKWVAYGGTTVIVNKLA